MFSRAVRRPVPCRRSVAAATARIERGVHAGSELGQLGPLCADDPGARALHPVDPR